MPSYFPMKKAKPSPPPPEPTGKENILDLGKKPRYVRKRLVGEELPPLHKETKPIHEGPTRHTGPQDKAVMGQLRKLAELAESGDKNAIYALARLSGKKVEDVHAAIADSRPSKGQRATIEDQMEKLGPKEIRTLQKSDKLTTSRQFPNPLLYDPPLKPGERRGMASPAVGEERSPWMPRTDNDVAKKEAEDHVKEAFWSSHYRKDWMELRKELEGGSGNPGPLAKKHARVQSEWGFNKRVKGDVSEAHAEEPANPVHSEEAQLDHLESKLSEALEHPWYKESWKRRAMLETEMGIQALRHFRSEPGVRHRMLEIGLSDPSHPFAKLVGAPGDASGRGRRGVMGRMAWLVEKNEQSLAEPLDEGVDPKARAEWVGKVQKELHRVKRALYAPAESPRAKARALAQAQDILDALGSYEKAFDKPSYMENADRLWKKTRGPADRLSRQVPAPQPPMTANEARKSGIRSRIEQLRTGKSLSQLQQEAREKGREAPRKTGPAPVEALRTYPQRSIKGVGAEADFRNRNAAARNAARQRGGEDSVSMGHRGEVLKNLWAVAKDEREDPTVRDLYKRAAQQVGMGGGEFTEAMVMGKKLPLATLKGVLYGAEKPPKEIGPEVLRALRLVLLSSRVVGGAEGTGKPLPKRRSLPKPTLIELAKKAKMYMPSGFHPRFRD